MNCEWINEHVALYVYDELTDDAKYELEQHINRCLRCKHEVESALEFKRSMASAPAPELSPNLLASSRLRLQEVLEEAAQSHGWSRFVFDLTAWMHQIKLAPALTTAVLLVGFAGGSLTTWRVLESRTASVPNPAGDVSRPVNSADISGIESITPAADSNKVAIKFDVVTPQVMEGSPDDPDIHQLLLLATRNTNNSGVRLDSIQVLTRQTEDNAVREALIYALHYDKNPGVRLKALDGLKTWVKEDVHVRDAVVEALMHDSNAGVRSEAIELLDPVRADMSVREALQVLAAGDKDRFIRSQSQRYLASTPNLY